MSRIKQSLLLTAVTTSLTSLFLSTALNAEVISGNVAPDIQEPSGTYDNSTPNLLNMRVETVISSGPCITSDYSGCTLNDVLNDIVRDDYSPEVRVKFTSDDFPDDGLVSNAELRQRGKASRLAPQKSFRVKLDKNIPNPFWRGERRIQLNKSPWERTRILQKLSYDLFKDIPHIPSMRTQFVHLDMVDQGVTHDYGLYTQIEHFGKEYLERRGWHKDSRVYKPKYFWYQNSPAFRLDSDGKPLDKDAFEALIEIKRGKKHQKFYDMIQAMNDRSLDFDSEVFSKFFNVDNYLTWFAINILTNNTDTTAKNFYLFNPKSSEKFYLVPWDYDYAWGENYEDIDHLPRWWFSHSNWWSVKFHKRFLQEPGNLNRLKSAIAEVKNKYLSRSKINAKKNAYYDIVFPVIRNTPDWNYIKLGGGGSPERVAEYNRIFDNLSNIVESNYARFLERANDPMTFEMEDPEFRSNHDIRFRWNDAESLTGQTIIYDLDISNNKEFSGAFVEQVKNISTNRYTLRWRHLKGTYYFRVVARDAANPQNNWQISSDSELNYSNGDELYGVKQFVVTEDGDTTNPPPPPPPSGSVSNPVSSINVDGSSSDWNSLTLFPNDPNDISGSNNVIDWKNAGIAHNDQTVYLIYRNRGSIDPNSSSGSSISWGWQTFIDSDNNPSTGFNISNVFGVDYMLEGRDVLKYTGSGSNWNWQTVGRATSRYRNDIEELSFPRSFIGNPQSMHVIFEGANNAFGGNRSDVYPDNAYDRSQNTGRYFSYSFGNVPPPTNQAPVAINQNLSVVVNTRTNITLNASDADGDALSLNIIQQPTNGTLTGSGLFVQYTPDNNYTGSDSFRYRVNDGTVNSNTATVSINVVDDNPGNGISNPVVNGGIIVNGSRSDWNNLTLFASDPDDVSGGSTNVIDWRRAGLAHSNDTVYVMYENRGNVNPSRPSGSFLGWGWQTYLDTDNNPNTGYSLNGSLGADYMIEGNNVFRYNGSGWNWTNVGSATTRYNNTIAELSFPRNWLGSHSSVKVAFLGNNEAFDGASFDDYPNNGSFEYFFGSGSFGRITPVSSSQSSRLNSPQDHEPSLTPSNADTGTTSGGGSVPWLLLLTSLCLIRRRAIS